MKTSEIFLKEQLQRARRIISRRVLLGANHVGSVVTLIIQGNGNMLSSRPAMIYNVNATTLERAQAAKAALTTPAFMAACDDMDEAQVQAHVNTILNNSQVSFTVPANSATSFNRGEVVKALVERYSVPAREASADGSQPARAAYNSIGVNNVSLATAVETTTAQSFFGGWDDDDSNGAAIEQPASAIQPSDAFSDDVLNAEAAPASTEAAPAVAQP